MRVRVPVLHSVILGTASLAAMLVGSPAQGAAQPVVETNLVTDNQAFLASQGFTPAATEDQSLINPWGLSFGPTSPFWISNQGAGNTTLYNGLGAKQPLTVTIPGPGNPTGPTGQVFNPTSDFALPTGGKALFLFANLNGTISGWNSAQGTNAVPVAGTPPGPNGPSSIYTGLALGNSGGQNYLYAANDLTGHIDVFNSSFAPTTLTGNFTDPTLPAGLVPFNDAVIDGKLWVTYAIAGPNADEAALGQGVVDVFNLDGTFDRRFASGGNLLSPWGITKAPATFQNFANAILVGNFSDSLGYVNAFRESDGAYLGMLALSDSSGPFNIPYLWALSFGNGGTGFNPNALYFNAGIGDEAHGLFARLDPVPEPAEWALLTAGFALAGWRTRRRASLRFA